MARKYHLKGSIHRPTSPSRTIGVVLGLAILTMASTGTGARPWPSNGLDQANAPAIRVAPSGHAAGPPNIAAYTNQGLWLAFSEGAGNGPSIPDVGEAELILRLIPMHEPVQTLVLVLTDGTYKKIHYSNARRTVLSAFKGRASEQEVGELLARLNEVSFRDGVKALQRTGDGLTSGDQFSLWARGPAVDVSVNGFVEDAPAPVREMIDAVTSLAGAGNKVAPAVAYVTAHEIPPPRAKWLSASNRVVFIDVRDVAAPVAEILSLAASNTHELISIDKAMHDELSDLTTMGTDIFFLKGGVYYQSELFLGSTS